MNYVIDSGLAKNFLVGRYCGNSPQKVYLSFKYIYLMFRSYLSSV